MKNWIFFANMLLILASLEAQCGRDKNWLSGAHTMQYFGTLLSFEMPQAKKYKVKIKQNSNIGKYNAMISNSAGQLLLVGCKIVYLYHVMIRTVVFYTSINQGINMTH